MPNKIYVASSWRNAFQPGIVTRLRAAGHQVYDFRNPPESTCFQWSEIDPDWLGWSPADLRRGLAHERATAGFGSDKAGMDWADVCVIVLPCGRSAHLEAGYMAGQGKRVLIWTDGAPQEPELMYLLFGAPSSIVIGSEPFAGLEEPEALASR